MSNFKSFTIQNRAINFILLNNGSGWEFGKSTKPKHFLYTISLLVSKKMAKKKLKYDKFSKQTYIILKSYIIDYRRIFMLDIL